MSATLTLSGDWLTSLGNRKLVNGTGNLGTYASGGISITAGAVGLGVLDEFIALPAGGYVFEYTGSVVKAYVQDGTATNPLAEVATNTNLAGTTFRFVALGK